MLPSKWLGIPFCKLDCSQAYHCLKMADQRPVKMLAFSFDSRTFAYRRLAQGLSRCFSAILSLIWEYLDPVIKAVEGAHIDDDIDIAANNPQQLLRNLNAVFACTQKAGLKLIFANWPCGVEEVDSLGFTITQEGIAPQELKKNQNY